MNNLTIVTKLRFIAALAPAILLIAAAVIAGAFHVFGTLPREIHDNEYAAERAAQGMETALYKMDWGRTQPDASQIVMDQQRGFISEIEIARQHIGSREQAELIEKIANDARPLFDAMRTASPSDDSLEPKLRDLQGSVADLMSVDDAAVIAVANSAESQARAHDRDYGNCASGSAVDLLRIDRQPVEQSLPRTKRNAPPRRRSRRARAHPVRRHQHPRPIPDKTRLPKTKPNAGGVRRAVERNLICRRRFLVDAPAVRFGTAMKESRCSP